MTYTKIFIAYSRSKLFRVSDGSPIYLATVSLLKERMNRSLMVCQDKFEAAKLKQLKTGALSELESCVDQAVQENIQMLPHIVDRLKASLSIDSYADK
ncbi:hypothetical protein ACLOJK_011727 [Asimina triloba]